MGLWTIPDFDTPGHPEAIVRLMIREIGDDPDREGLKETPERVARMWREMFSGYDEKPEELFKTFADGACDEMVVVRDIEAVSFCEHHMLPFLLVAHVAYIPNGKVIGLSKIPRLVDVFARRLQLQERLTQQITHTIYEHLKPKGVACVIEARHLCLSCRGARKQNATMVTSSLLGAFKTDQSTRNEFLNLVLQGRGVSR